MNGCAEEMVSRSVATLSSINWNEDERVTENTSYTKREDANRCGMNSAKVPKTFTDAGYDVGLKERKM